MNTYHLKYRNLMRERLTRETVAGARPHGDWCIVSSIGDDPIHELRENKIKILKQTNRFDPKIHKVEFSSAKHSVPIVFEVLAIGPDVKHVQVGEHVSVTFMAGDVFAGSSIVSVQEKDIVFTFGKGLELSTKELSDKNAEFQQLAQFFQDEHVRQEKEKEEKAEKAKKLAAEREKILATMSQNELVALPITDEKLSEDFSQLIPEEEPAKTFPKSAITNQAKVVNAAIEAAYAKPSSQLVDSTKFTAKTKKPKVKSE